LRIAKVRISAPANAVTQQLFNTMGQVCTQVHVPPARTAPSHHTPIRKARISLRLCSDGRVWLNKPVPKQKAYSERRSGSLSRRLSKKKIFHSARARLAHRKRIPEQPVFRRRLSPHAGTDSKIPEMIRPPSPAAPAVGLPDGRDNSSITRQRNKDRQRPPGHYQDS